VVEHARLNRHVSHDHFTVDGTLLEAWASIKSFKPKDGAKRNRSWFLFTGAASNLVRMCNLAEAALNRRSAAISGDKGLLRRSGPHPSRQGRIGRSSPAGSSIWIRREPISTPC
jgi:hypothetical protein